MSYRDDFLKKLQQLRDYKTKWENDLDNALKFQNVLPAKEISYQLGKFLRRVTNSPDLFGGKDKKDAFFAKHAALFPKKRLPDIETTLEHCEVNIEEADYEAILDALDAEFKDRPEVLDNLFYKECSPDIRANRHPMEGVIDAIKKDVDALYAEEEAKAELKEALDFANNELVEKTGPNLVDNAIDANSNLRSIKARKQYEAYVVEKGLDPNKVKNQSTRLGVISPDMPTHPENFEAFKPFLDMGVSFNETYKQKLLGLEALCQKEGLLVHAQGGESGSKEYGLADYFQKNYALKRALLDYGKLTEEQSKKEALEHIKALTEDVKTVTAKYERVFDYIKENFDLENVSLSGNVYSGRPSAVIDNDLEKWRPNLPPKFDFENSPAVIFLSGFTQLKAACNAQDATLEEYIDDPAKCYMAGFKKYTEPDDKKIYLPRGEENTLGKRMAHVFCYSSRCYSEISAVAMMGGRGMEFLYNTSPSDEKTIPNVIHSSIIKDYSHLHDHNPQFYFGDNFRPDVDKIKNIFAAGDNVDSLNQVSPSYVSEECKIDPAVKDYAATVRTHGNTPIDQEYRRVMKALKDCFEEEEDMAAHPEQHLKPGKDSFIRYPHGALIAAGRQYFADYLRENNLDLASVEDDQLRNEMYNFMVNPVQTFHENHFQFEEEGLESLEDVENDFASSWEEYGSKHSEAFFAKFNQNNQKPNGYNAGKDIPTILNDNRGGWWERRRGTTSMQYQALTQVTRAALNPDSPTHGDKEQMYICAKAYREHKMPGGRRPFWLSSTAKKRLEFCDSIINAYEQEKAEREAANNPAPAQEENNNIIIDQGDFQNQLQNDLGPKEAQNVKPEVIQEAAAEKDPPEDGVEV